jgi:hypothetical protein
MTHPDEFKINALRKRRLYLEKLGVELITPNLEARVEEFSNNNFRGCQSPLMNAFKKTGQTFSRITSPVSIDKNSPDSGRKKERVEKVL